MPKGKRFHRDSQRVTTFTNHGALNGAIRERTNKATPGTTSPGQLVPRPGLRQSIWPPLLLLAALLVAWYFAVNHVTPIEVPDPEPPQEPGIIWSPRQDQENERRRREEYYAEQVQPILEELRRLDQEAAERCIQRINDAFDRYRQGIKPFTEDLTSMSTRIGILWRMPRAWWRKDDEVRRFVQAKLEEYVISQQKLERDISAALLAFRDDLRANSNTMLTQVKARVSASDLPDVVIPDYELYCKQISARLSELAATRGQDSVYHGIATMLTSEIAGVVVVGVVTRILASVGTQAAVTTAATGGATVGGAAAGAGGGSTIGPVGTAIGFVAGTLVGIIVDWYMTDKFEAKIERELNDYLNRTRYTLLEGGNGQRGLRQVLTDIANDHANLSADLLYEQIVGSVQ